MIAEMSNAAAKCTTVGVPNAPIVSCELLMRASAISTITTN